MTSLRQKRLLKEVQLIEKNPVEYVTAGPSEKDISKWKATIVGPEDTPYQHGIFELDITFPEKFPYEPPKLLFKTPIYHPNIYKGEICLDILKTNWSPSLTISKVLLSLCSLLSEPNPKDPLNPPVAKLYLENYDKFKANAIEATIKYAT